MKRYFPTLFDLSDITRIADLVFDSIIVLDMHDRIIFWNQVAVRQYGWSKEEAEGQIMHGLLHTEFTAPIEEIKSSLLQYGRWEGNLTRNTREGVRLTTLSRWDLQRDHKGAALCVVVVEKNITKPKRVWDQREQLVVGIENAAEGFYILDTESKFEYVNSTYCNMTGYSKEELLGSNIAMLRSDTMSDVFYKSAWARIQLSDVWTGRMTRKRKNGTLFQTEVAVARIKDGSGKIVNYVGVARDITEQLALEEQLRQSHKMEAIGTLAGGIAHDFNNILAAIVGNAELALEDVSEDAAARFNIEQILKAAIRGRDLVQQILTFTKKTKEKRESIVLSSLVQETHTLLRASVPASIELVLFNDAVSDWVEADPTQIQQVLLNLVANAVDALEDRSGVITTRISDVSFGPKEPRPEADMPPGKYLAINVSDTGCGMAEAVMSRVFEPFFTTKESGGTGMGLAVAYGIARAYRGAISVSSRAGIGSTFTLYLPKLPIPLSAEDKGTSLAQNTGGNERILFVDDEESLLLMGKNMLERLGYQVTTANDGIDALAKFEANPQIFDLVITDQTMPRMTGMALIHEFKKIRPDIPAILCSGHNHTVTPKTSAKLGVKLYVSKPFTKTELARAIRTALEERSSLS